MNRVDGGGRRRVLYVCHNHPMNRPGGAEVYAHELYRAVRDTEFEPILVAKVGPPFSDDVPHEGTRFGLVGGDRNEYFVYTSADEFDRLFGTLRRKQLYTDDWPAFLDAIAPQLVHFQHTLFLGYDMLRATRAALPSVPIVYTLHEFLPICHHSGQMVRTDTHELCYAASPRRCHECFPNIPGQTFFLRERFIKSAFQHVDMFITPSEHARRRYVEWGIAPEKILHEDYGRLAAAPLPDPPQAGSRRRIGFFGQITPFKGVELLLEAIKILASENVEVELLLNGGNLEHQQEAFRRRILTLLEETEANVRFLGSYAQRELPALLSAVDWVVVPSIWWETGPLVIHEALAHGRPVICSDIGAMLERVGDETDGLLFHAGDPYSLADAIRRALDSPRLWQEIRGRIGDPHPMDEHLARITEIYDELLAGSSHSNAA